MSSIETREYTKLVPTTRLKGVVGELAKTRVALQHLKSYDGTNLSDSQVAAVTDAIVTSSTGAIAKLQDMRKRVSEYLKKV
jgi:hypothetical protein